MKQRAIRNHTYGFAFHRKSVNTLLITIVFVKIRIGVPRFFRSVASSTPN